MALRQCIPSVRRLQRNSPAPPVVKWARPTSHDVVSSTGAATTVKSRTWVARPLTIGTSCFMNGDGFGIGNQKRPPRVIAPSQEPPRWPRTLPQLRWMSRPARQRRQKHNFRDHQSLGDLSQMAYHHKDVLTNVDIAAFWTEVSKLLRKLNRRDRERNPDATAHHEAILSHTLDQIGAFRCRHLAQTSLGMAKIVDMVEGKRNPVGSAHQILADVFIGNSPQRKHAIFTELAEASLLIGGEFEPRSLSNVIYAFGKAGCAVKFGDGSKFFDDLALLVLPHVNHFNSQGLWNILWAYANVEQPNPQLFKQVGDTIASSSDLNSFDPQALSNTVWAYATLGTSHLKMFERIANHVVGLGSLDAFEPQNLSIMVWAFANAKKSHPSLFEKVAYHVVGSDLNSFNPQALSVTVWAFATSGTPHSEMFQRVADHIVELGGLDAYKPQEISNTVWAYATANESQPRLFEKVADYVVALDSLNYFKPQELSNLVWAFATANESHSSLFERVGDHAVALSNLNRFKPQELSNLAWAFATANEPHPALFKQVANHIVELDHLNAFQPQELSNMAWTYATAKEANHGLFQKLACAAIDRQTQFQPQSVASFLWAFAANGYGETDKHVYQSFMPKAKEVLHECNCQALTNIAWAYAVANVDASALFDEGFISACIEKEIEFKHEDWRQLHQWNLWQDELKSGVTLPPALGLKCHNAFVSTVPSPSILQNDVVSELRAIGLQLKEEVLLTSGYLLDAMVEVNGKKVGIEVDGPSHFLGRRPTGSTVLKRRQMPAIEGITMVYVPYWEWDQLKRDRTKKQRYLRSLLGLS